MSDPVAAAGVVAELFTWLGLLIGAALLLAALLRRAIRGPVDEHPGAVVSSDGAFLSFRWFGSDGGLHEDRGHGERGRHYDVGDEVTVYSPAHRPDRGRIDPVDHLSRALLLTGCVFTAVGVAAVALSVALMFA